MKYLFLVSSTNKYSLSKDQYIYLAEPYLNDYFKEYNEKSIIYADYNRETNEDLLILQQYIDTKCDNYTGKIAKLLNRVHGRKYKVEYWRKCFNLNFKRFLTLIHEAYLVFQKFSVDKHSAKMLDEKLFITPADFGDACDFVKGNEFATEQLFSIYLKLFHPTDYFEPFQREFSKNDSKLDLNSKSKYLFAKLNSLKDKNKIFSILIRRIYRIRQPVVAIVSSYFSYKHMNILLQKSRGLIQSIPVNIEYKGVKKVNFDLRTHIFDDCKIEDDFDRYAFAVLKVMMPKLYLEDYNEMEEKYKLISNQFVKLKYIFCEGFQSNDCLSLFLAVCKINGVKHIYNEHNFISHIYTGNNVQRLKDMCDEYITLGWNDKKYSNLTKGASLFQFDLEGPYSPSNEILYLSHFIPVKRLDYFGGYRQVFAEGGIRYVNFQNRFFDKLNNKAKEELVYRGYLEKEKRKYIFIDDLLALKKHLSEIKYIDDRSLTAKQMFKKSRLTIISYISTSFLEVLIMNVPSIIFIETANNPLLDRYKSYFDDLVDACICHKDPHKAAEFVNSIYPDKVESWWFGKKVQAARETFLAQNIGNPPDMMQYILGLLKEPHA
jgi:putative transferase (TIGR04331 family)